MTAEHLTSFEFTYEAECRPWKAPKRGVFNTYTPEPYASFREEFTLYLKAKFPGVYFLAENRLLLWLKIVKKRKNGDLSNLQKACEDCLQLAGIIPNDEAHDQIYSSKRQTTKGEQPYIWGKIEVLK